MSKTKPQQPKRRLWWTVIAFLVVVLVVTAAACTPGQIEEVFTQLDTPFESGYDLQSVEAGLFRAAAVLSLLIPGLGLGLGFPI